MMFTNREQAGNLLTKKLTAYSHNKQAVVVAIPRGGVPIGYVIAKKLNLPLEIVLSKKIGHPHNKEYAIGAVTLKSIILSDAAEGVSKAYIEKESEHIRDVLKKRHQAYYGRIAPLQLTDRIIIVVDDGVATGNTLLSSIQLIEKEKPSKIIVALPVAPASALKKIRELNAVDEVICLEIPINFYAVGQFYEIFDQVPDNVVIKLLKEVHMNYSNS